MATVNIRGKNLSYKNISVTVTCNCTETPKYIALYVQDATTGTWWEKDRKTASGSSGAWQVDLSGVLGNYETSIKIRGVVSIDDETSYSSAETNVDQSGKFDLNVYHLITGTSTPVHSKTTYAITAGAKNVSVASYTETISGYGYDYAAPQTISIMDGSYNATIYYKATTKTLNLKFGDSNISSVKVGGTSYTSDTSISTMEDTLGCEAFPASGYTFYKWKLDSYWYTQNPITVDMTNDHTITVYGTSSWSDQSAILDNTALSTQIRCNISDVVNVYLYCDDNFIKSFSLISSGDLLSYDYTLTSAKESVELTYKAYGGLGEVLSIATYTVSNTKCTLSYDPNGGTSTPAPQTTYKGGSVVLALGINHNSESAGTEEVGNYTVTYNANGGSAGKTSDTAKIVVNKTKNYTFNSWQIGSMYYVADTSYTILSDITAKATWDTSTSKGSPYTKSITLTTAILSGWELEGWYVGSTFIGKAGATYKPSSNITLTAQWKGNYKLTLNAGEGKFDSTGSNILVVSSSEITKGSSTSITISSEKPKRTGYVFTNWRDSNGITYNPGDNLTVSSDITLSAVWTPYLQVTFEVDSNQGTLKDNGTVSSNPLVVNVFSGTTYSISNDIVTIKDIDNKTRNISVTIKDGYKNKIDKRLWAGKSDTGSITNNTTFTAQLIGKIYEVTINDGSTSVNTVVPADGYWKNKKIYPMFGNKYSYNYGSTTGTSYTTFNLPKASTFSRPYFTFKWWEAVYKSGSKVITVWDVTDDTLVSIANNHSLVAKWDYIPYKITFTYEDPATKVIGTCETIPFHSDETTCAEPITTIPISGYTPPVPEGWIFLGWMNPNDPNEILYSPGDTVRYSEQKVSFDSDTHTLGLVAMWLKDRPVRVSLGGGAMAPITEIYVYKESSEGTPWKVVDSWWANDGSKWRKSVTYSNEITEI